MGDVKALLELRRKIKSRKPVFLRTDYRKFVKLRKKKWRAPRGRHNKVRRRLRGALPCPGYGSPAAVRGMHPRGMHEQLIYSLRELLTVDKHKLVRIAASVGNRKKIEIVREAKRLGLHILNPRIRVKAKKEKEEEKKDEASHDKAATEDKPRGGVVNRKKGRAKAR